MPYWKLYYHLIWGTRDREPLLTPDLEATVHGYLRAKATGLGARVFALNGVEDHVHLVVSVPPKISVARFVGQVKAVASTKLNKSNLLDRPFSWQSEYGAFSFDAKRLANFVAYVENQKQHHEQRTTIPVLERMGALNPSSVSEDQLPYGLDDATWRSELTNGD